MSKVFATIVRSSIQPLRSSFTLRANIRSVMARRIYTENSVPEDTVNAMPVGQSNNLNKRKRQRYNPKPKEPKPIIIKSLGKECNLHTPNGVIPYTSCVDNEELVQKLLMALAAKRQRNLKDCIVLEGKTLIADAIKAGCVPHTILFSRAQDVLNLPLPKDVKLYRTRYRTLQLWSTLTTSPGILGIFHKPDLETVKPSPNALPLTIMCNNIRDPGNLGSILRNAATVGCDMVILTKGCVDLWSPKVLRAAAGAHFCMPICADRSWEDIVSFIKPDTNIYIADNTTTFHPNGASNLSNHSMHIDPPKDDNTAIDIDDIDTEEDNCAEEDHSEETEKFENAKNDVKSTTNSRKQRDHTIREVLDLKAQIPVVPYYSVDYTEKHNTLVIGGETECLSKELLCYFPKHNTIRVNIPMSNGFDSLNTATSTGILAFEIKRQILSK